MTVLELTSASRTRVSRRPVATRRRFGLDARGGRMTTPPTTPSRMIEIDELRARIARGDYTVDAGKVADAIVERLLAGRSGRDAGR